MAKTLGLPLGLIWKDQAIDNPFVPPPPPIACAITQIQADGTRGMYTFSITAGSSVGVMKLVFNTGNYLLPSNSLGGSNGVGPAQTVNAMGDRMKWSHGIYNNQDAGSSIAGNFYVNDSSGATDVPVVAVDTINTSINSNLEKIKQIGLLGGEKLMLSANSSNKINSVNHLRGSVPKTGSYNVNLTGNPSFGQSSDGIYTDIPMFEYNTSSGQFAQLVVNGVNQTTTLGPYDGWINRNSSNPNNTLTPAQFGSLLNSAGNDGDIFDIESLWTTEVNSTNIMKNSPQGNLSVSQMHQYWPSFHASRNTVFCVPIIPNNISDGKVTIVVEAPLEGTWFGVAAQCPVDLETADSGNHKINRSALQTNWNQTCNQGGVNNTIYHMPIDGFGTFNPASVGRDENGIPIKTKMNHSPALDNQIGVFDKYNDIVVSQLRTADTRILWETLVTTNYITKNGRSAWKTAMTGGTNPDTLLRYWYGMRDSAKCNGSFSFPASNKITCPTFSAAAGAPTGASAVPEVGDLVVTGSDNTFGNHGTSSNITVTAVNGQTISVSGLITHTTETAMDGLTDPTVTFVRMGDIQTQGYLNPTAYNSGSAVDAVDELTGQPNGDIGIRDYMFEDRYGAVPVANGFYKIIDKNGVDNGNGGKKRIKIKDGIIIKCRNCFGSIKTR
jgi:hypothetical protein